MDVTQSWLFRMKSLKPKSSAVRRRLTGHPVPAKAALPRGQIGSSVGLRGDLWCDRRLQRGREGSERVMG